MSCEVCAAPPLPLAGACVFCRSPLPAEADAAGLLDYLAARVPGARVRRSGVLRRGPVGDLRVAGLRGRLRGERLVLQPEAAPAEWADRLLAVLSAQAAGDPGARAALSRSGWALR